MLSDPSYLGERREVQNKKVTQFLCYFPCLFFCICAHISHYKCLYLLVTVRANNGTRVVSETYVYLVIYLGGSHYNDQNQDEESSNPLGAPHVLKP